MQQHRSTHSSARDSASAQQVCMQAQAPLTGASLTMPDPNMRMMQSPSIMSETLRSMFGATCFGSVDAQRWQASHTHCACAACL